MVLITSLTSKMQQELNVLIPVQNTYDSTAGSVVFPTRVTIAFCNFTRTSNGIRNQMNIVSVYRAFGATTAGSITSSILPINRMDLNLFTYTLGYSSTSFYAETGNYYSALYDNVTINRISRIHC